MSDWCVAHSTPKHYVEIWLDVVSKVTSVADTEVLLRNKLKASRSVVKGIRTFLNGVDTWDSLRQLTWRWTLGWISFLRDYVMFKALNMAHREFRKVAALRHAAGHSCNGWQGVMSTAHRLLVRRRNTPERECVCVGGGGYWVAWWQKCLDIDRHTLFTDMTLRFVVFPDDQTGNVAFCSIKVQQNCTQDMRVLQQWY
jgi:hypothetical protein